nr:HNH endonuclease [Patulibacter sp. DM4]
MTTLDRFLREDAGTPLGVGMPSGRPLRLDGERHYDAWLRLLRADPCAYCGARTGTARTIDHVEPRSRSTRGIGSAHGWINVVAACQRCNGAKADRPLLLFLLTRRAGGRRRRGRTRGREIPTCSHPGRVR